MDAAVVRRSMPELKLLAMREHSLLSLFELGHELMVVLEAPEIADVALFNLMGHFGTPQAVLWLTDDEGTGQLVGVRARGLRAEIGEALGRALEPVLPRCPLHFGTPVRIEDALRLIDPAALALAERSGIALFAPLVAGQRAIGFVALGRRANGMDFSDLDLDVLNISLGMVAVAFENRRLYRQLEDQNAELTRANHDLRALDRMKSEFIQNVNHELRTPLAIIIGSVDCLLADQDPDARRNRLVAGMQEQASRLQRMVQMLLDFSGALDGSLELHVVDFDPRPVLAEYYTLRRPAVIVTHPGFALDVEHGRSLARCDRTRLTQIIELLVDNAVKFTPPETPITLSLREHEEQGERSIRIDVRDEGPGIPAELAGHLFQPFRQGDGSMTRRVGGMGLGLATARRIAERMGVRLVVESAAGRGTQASLRLPRVEPRDGTGARA